MEKERKQTEFHGDVDYLTRFNILWTNCDISSTTLNASDWYHNLNAVFRELSSLMDDKEIILCNAFLMEIKDLVNEQITRAERSGKQEMSQHLYLRLHEYELALRKIFKKTGLQSKMKDDMLEV